MRRALEIGAVVLAGLIAGILASSPTMGVAVALLVVMALAAAVLLSRPSLMVFLTFETMWFDAVGFGPVTMGRAMAGLATVVVVARIVGSDWRPPAFQARAFAPIAIFVGWALVSGMWSAGLGQWGTGLFQLALGVMYGLVVMLFLESERQLELAARIFMWLGVPIAAVSFVVFRAVQDVGRQRGAEVRVVSFTGNANAYAFVLLSAIPIAAVFFLRSATRRQRLVYLGIGAVLVLAIISTGSRAGLINLGVVGVYLFATYPGLSNSQRARSATIGIGVAVVGVVVAAILNPERYSLTAFFGDGGAGRLDIWNAAVGSFGQHPILGGGIGSFREQALDALSKVSGGTLDATNQISARGEVSELEAHNMYLTLLLDLGVVGLALWGVLYVSVARNLWDLRKTAWRDWAWCFGATWLAMAVHAFFGSSYNVKMQWTVIGFSAAMYVRKVAAPARSESVASLDLAPVRQLEAGPRAPGFGGGERNGDGVVATADVRLRHRFGRVVIAMGLLGSIFGVGLAAMFVSTQYVASQEVWVVKMDDPTNQIEIVDGRLQFVLNIARTGPFNEEVARRARLSLSATDVAKVIEPTRPRFSNVVQITVTSPDRELVERIRPVLLPALDTVVGAARRGSSQLLDEDGRALAPDVPSDYTGPMYVSLGAPSDVDVLGPPYVKNAIVGFIAFAFATLVGALLIHNGSQLSTKESIASRVGVPFVARLPRWRGGRRDNADYFISAADVVDAACESGANIVALCGPQLRSAIGWHAIGVGLGLAVVRDRPVVIVDLDGRVSAESLVRRHGGFGEMAEDGLAPEDAVVALSKWRCPANLRPMVSKYGDRVRLMPRGRSSDTLTAEQISAAIERLSEGAIVVIALPSVPGPMPLADTLVQCDAVLVEILDGSTTEDSVNTLIDSIEVAAAGRIGYVVVEN